MSDFGLGDGIVDEQALTDALRWHGLLDDDRAEGNEHCEQTTHSVGDATIMRYCDSRRTETRKAAC